MDILCVPFISLAQCGDGIMSAIDMYMTVRKVQGKQGETRVVVTFNGKVRVGCLLDFNIPTCFPFSSTFLKQMHILCAHFNTCPCSLFTIPHRSFCHTLSSEHLMTPHSSKWRCTQYSLCFQAIWGYLQRTLPSRPNTRWNKCSSTCGNLVQKCILHLQSHEKTGPRSNSTLLGCM